MDDTNTNELEITDADDRRDDLNAEQGGEWKCRLTDQELAEFEAAREEAGRLIDPETAEMDARYVYDVDPYGLYEVPPYYQSVGRTFFVRSPGSDLEVWIGNLAGPIQEALQKKRDERREDRKWEATASAR